MKTKKNKITKNKTIKKRHIEPSVKIFKIGNSLYGAKSHSGEEILKYTKSMSQKNKKKCLIHNISWFSNLEIAKNFNSNSTNTHIYRWKITKNTKLLKVNRENEYFINNLFLNSTKVLTTTINISKNQEKKINYDHPYINMSQNEKALYEFSFAFGFITIKEQYEFMKLVKYLIENDILDIKNRTNESILTRVMLLVNYYNVNLVSDKNEKYDRLSFYKIDQNAILNLCKLVNKIYNISGIYCKNINNFWIHLNIIPIEFALFNPHENLSYVEMVE